ncbi:serotriflin-like [Heteronotia binoei]|uniref:serotriflin-like n=1 Tax=Heteronotia binoei TaxID=13085 RepID=UPI00292FF74B|nr:serotriflin-like [Heteronotia binoei]
MYLRDRLLNYVPGRALHSTARNLLMIPGLKEEEDEHEDENENLPGSGVSRRLQKEIVDMHNEIRRNVKPTASNMLKMRWDETVGESAKRWTDKCQSVSSPMEERTFDGVLCSQSLFLANYLFSWSEILEYWQNKSRYFMYGVGPIDPQQNVYGYTQVIWYRSYKVGCAVSYCPKNKHKYIYMCLYCPAGNIVEEITTPYKNGPPCGDCPKRCEDKLCTNPCKYMDRYTNCPVLKGQVGCKTANQEGYCNATCKCKNRIK